MQWDTEESSGRKGNTEMTLGLGPVEHDFDELGRGRKYMAVEAVYAKAQRHEKVVTGVYGQLGRK